MPSLSWAIDPTSYPAPVSHARLANPLSHNLAAEYAVPPTLGQITEASFAPGKNTIILVQDLHCNYEIQGNIRKLLAHLTQKHPKLKLVAIEGAAGILPTLDLANIPDSPAKRGVSDYFMRQGKLSGADSFAINDRSDVELFGAEAPQLYRQSLSLIQRFTTDENRGIIQEIMERMAAVEDQTYNPDLKKFEQLRRAALKGEITLENYRPFLEAQAKRVQLNLLPTELVAEGKSATKLDFQDQELQRAYLENGVRSRLARSTREKALLQQQRFLELVERLINVSAAREDMTAFQQEKTLSINGIIRQLETATGATVVSAEEIDGLQAGLEQAVSFYRLAEQRNRALLENTLRRGQERNESVLVLITGGYHTQAVASLIRGKGQSFVTVRPEMSKPDNSEQYFQLLRDPFQRTELEEVITALPARTLAIAVADALTFPSFRAAFTRAVGATQNALVRMRNEGARYINLRPSPATPAPDVFVAAGPDRAVVDNSLEGLRSQAEGLARFIPSLTKLHFWSGVRIIGLLTMGIGLTVMVLEAAVLAPIAPWVGALTLLSLAGIAAWQWAVNNNWRIVLKPEYVVVGTFALGLLFVTCVGLPFFSDMFSHAAGQTVSSVSHLNFVTNGVQEAFAALPVGQLVSTGATPDMVLHATDQIARAGVGTGASLFVVGGTLVRAGVNAVRTARDIFTSESTPEKLWKGETWASRRNRAFLTNIENEGIEYTDNYTRAEHMASHPEAIAFVTGKAADTMERVLMVNGIDHFAIPIRFRSKPVLHRLKLNPDGSRPKAIREMPVSGEVLLFGRNKPVVEFSCSAVVTDPMLQDEEKRPITDTTVHELYAQDLLDSWNPAIVYRAISSRAEALLSRAVVPKVQDLFRRLLRTGTEERWTKRAWPQAFEKAQLLTTLGILHEFVHGLALHVPDAVPETTAQDNAEVRANLERLRSMDINHFVAMIGGNQAIMNGMTAYKNAIKALRTQEKLNPSQQTNDGILLNFFLEMFCDRYSMFLFENYLKSESYLRALQTLPANKRKNSLGYGEFADLQRANREGRLQQELARLQPEVYQRLMSELQQAESEHIYFEMGEPALTPQERVFYQDFSDWLNEQDNEGTGKVGKMENSHASKSRWTNISVIEQFEVGQAPESLPEAMTSRPDEVGTALVEAMTPPDRRGMRFDQPRAEEMDIPGAMPQPGAGTLGPLTGLDLGGVQAPADNFTQPNDISTLMAGVSGELFPEAAQQTEDEGELVFAGGVEFGRAGASNQLKVQGATQAVGETRNRGKEALGYTDDLDYGSEAAQPRAFTATLSQLATGPGGVAPVLPGGTGNNGRMLQQGQAVGQAGVADLPVAGGAGIPGRPQGPTSGLELGVSGERLGTVSGPDAFGTQQTAAGVPAPDALTGFVNFADLGPNGARQVAPLPAPAAQALQTGGVPAAEAALAAGAPAGSVIVPTGGALTGQPGGRPVLILAGGPAGTLAPGGPGSQVLPGGTRTGQRPTTAPGSPAGTAGPAGTHGAMDLVNLLRSASNLIPGMLPGAGGVGGGSGITGGGVGSGGGEVVADRAVIENNRPAQMLESVVAPQRARTILAAMLAMTQQTGAVSPVNLALDNATLAQYIYENAAQVLRDLDASGKDWQNALASILITLLPVDPATGQRTLPADWNLPNTLVVVTEELANQRLATLTITDQGTYVNTQMVAVPYAQAQQTLNPQQFAQLQAEHQAVAQQMRVSQGFDGQYLFLNPDANMTVERLRLLELVASFTATLPVDRRVDQADRAVQTAAAAVSTVLQDRLPKTMAGRARPGTVELEVTAYEKLVRAAAKADLGVIRFGLGDVVVAASVPEANDLVFAGLPRNAKTAPGTMTQPLEMMDGALAAPTNAQERSQLAGMRQQLRKVLDDPTVRSLSDQEVRDLSHKALVLDSMTVVASGRLVTGMSPGKHAVEVQAADLNSLFPDLTPVEAFNRKVSGRLKVDPWVPQVDLKDRMPVKLVSRVFLFFVGLNLVNDAVKEVRNAGKAGVRLGLFDILRHPQFVRAVRLMLTIIFYPENAFERLPETIRQQVADMNKLTNRMLAGNLDLNTVILNQQERSLQFSLGQLKALIQQLNQSFFFGLLVRLLGIKNLVSMYPLILALLLQSNSLRSILWYFSPAMCLRQQIERQRDGLTATLLANLTRPAGEAKRLLDIAQAARTEEAAKAQPNENRLKLLDNQIRSLRFSLRFQESLTKLEAQNTPYQMRQVIKLLVRELGRQDVADPAGYQKGLLQVLTAVEPFQQMAVQVRLSSGEIVQTSLPRNLLVPSPNLGDQNSIMYYGVRTQLLNFIEVFDNRGEQIRPQERRMLSVRSAA